MAAARAELSANKALIAYQHLKNQLCGQSSERSARLLEQMEPGLAELQTAATEDEIAAEQAAQQAASGHTNVAAFTRRRPSLQPFPQHLPR